MPETRRSRWRPTAPGGTSCWRSLPACSPTGASEHHGPRHRRAASPLRPLPPLRLQGSMVRRILRTFQDLFGQYDDILASDADPLAGSSRRCRSPSGDRRAPRQGRDLPRTTPHTCHLRPVLLPRRPQPSGRRGLADAARRHRRQVLRDDLDLELTYRFIRDTVWVAVSWYRPGGRRTHTESPSSTSPSCSEGSTVPDSRRPHRRRRPPRSARERLTLAGSLGRPRGARSRRWCAVQASTPVPWTT